MTFNSQPSAPMPVETVVIRLVGLANAHAAVIEDRLEELEGGLLEQNSQ